MSAGDPAALVLSRAPALDRRRGERLAVRVIAVGTALSVLAVLALVFFHGAQG